MATAHSEERSMWQRFKDFFSPSEPVQGEGPLYDQLRSLDDKINRTEGKYSRERRPSNKQKIKKELDSLMVERETLLAEIEKSTVASSSSSVSEKKQLCSVDTVYVHDTVKTHDTLYVILANKSDKTDSLVKPDSLEPHVEQ
ncbi:MAG: hypothetical protein HUK20_14815 [Fibrobacter sp.]|nr:hypothetical protein [Fibrobacter sp.]